jgi:hypothetical protein
MKWAALKLLVKSWFKCVHFAHDCTADEFVKKVADDGKTETWNCWCTCNKCRTMQVPKTLTFEKGYMDQLRSMGLLKG